MELKLHLSTLICRHDSLDTGITACAILQMKTLKEASVRCNLLLQMLWNFVVKCFISSELGPCVVNMGICCTTCSSLKNLNFRKELQRP
jgi:hypothetical protein